MGLGKFLKKHGGRIAAGVATGGLSEVHRATQNHYQAKPAGVQQSPDLTNQIGQSYGQGQQFQQMLMEQAQGKGANPALAQLRQTTEENIRRTQGGIASQRGINPAMAARLGAYAAGDQNAQANQAAAIQRAQQILAAQQLGATSNLNQQQILQGALANYNNANVSAINGANAINAGVAGQNAQTNIGIIGGLAKGAGTAATGGAAGGGMAGGGVVGQRNPFAPVSELGRIPMFAASSGGEVPGQPRVFGNDSANDVVPAMLSPGEIVIPRTHAHSPEAAADFVSQLMKRQGKGEGYGKVAKFSKGGRAC